MKISNQNETVQKNLEVFKIILKKATYLYEIKSESKAQYFRAFIHRNRGEIQFPDLTTNYLDTKDWAPVFFHFSLPTYPEESFSLDISNLDHSQFSWGGLESMALTNLKETVKTMQFIARFLPKLSNLSAVLREFSAMNLDSFVEKISSKNLIHEAWHGLTKTECEHKLSKEQAGTFLFRKDPFAAMLEELLSQEHKQKIHCITLSYQSVDQKACDLTCVKKSTQWIAYNDDPKLTGLCYPSIHALLNSFRHLLKMPLLHK